MREGGFGGMGGGSGWGGGVGGAGSLRGPLPVIRPCNGGDDKRQLS